MSVCISSIFLGIEMIARSLKRNYQTMGLGRRNATADIYVRHVIMTELNENGNHKGVS